MKKLFIYLLLLSFSFSFSQEINKFDDKGKRHGVWKKNHKNSKVLRYEGEFNHGSEVGVFKFYKNIRGKAVLTATRDFTDNTGIAQVKFYTTKGKVISEGNMRGKLYVGTWKYYQKNSDQLLIQEYFDNEGKLEGERKVYYKNGRVAEVQNYKSGILEGTSMLYSEKGIVLKTFIYVKNKLHGVSKYYNAKGDLIVEGQYRKGKKHGDWKYYENGKLINTKNFTTESKYKKP